MPTNDRYTLGAFAVVCDDVDRVLVSHRRDLDLWNLPGGRVKTNEMPDVAVVREVNMLAEGEARLRDRSAEELR